MLTAAFTGWVVGDRCGRPSSARSRPGPLGITPALLIGLVAAILSAVGDLAPPCLAVDQPADRPDHQRHDHQHRRVRDHRLPEQRDLGGVADERRPVREDHAADGADDLPVVGWLFTTILNQGPITISLLVCAVVLQILLFRSRWGLRTRAVGEHPKAAETVGIDVIRLRYRNVLIGGVFAGLGGAFLSMELSNSFQAGGTAGRGFIALAAMIVGRWTPIGAFGAALLFSLFLTLGQTITFAPPTGELGEIVKALPSQVFSALPYIVTIVVLAGLIGRSTPPAADGRPYEREATA